MRLAERTSALLALVQEHQAHACAQAQAAADREVSAIMGCALSEGRGRVHNAIDEARKRYATEVSAARAALQTEQRLADQQQSMHLLALAWAELRDALARRWHKTDTRARWVDTYLNRALDTLVARDWRIRYEPTWPANERAVAAEALRAKGGVSAVFVADETLGAGFLVQAGYNVLDASLEGLLADRAALEGQLLQRLKEGGT